MLKMLFVGFLVTLNMCACSPDTTKTAGPRAETKPNTAAALLAAAEQPAQPAPQPNTGTPTVTGDGKTIVKKILVQREDSKRGIEAEVNRIDSEGKSFYFSSTDDSGVATPNQPCTSTDRFEAKPKISGFLRVALKACRETIAIELPSGQATYGMVLLGSEALKANDFAKAQAYYAAAATRLTVENNTEAVYLNSQARIAAGKALGVTEPTVSVDGVETFTMFTVKKLREYQTSKGLRATGILDVDTQEQLSGLKTTTVVNEALLVPPAKVEKLKWNSPISGDLLNEYKVITKTAAPSKFTFDPKIVDVKVHDYRVTMKNLETKENARELKAKAAAAKDQGRK